MNFTTTETCNTCGKEYKHWHDVDKEYQCSDCSQVGEILKENKYLQSLRRGKTIEQRVKQLEQMAYRAYKGEI